MASPARRASITVDGKSFDLQAQIGGQFPRVWVAPGMLADVQLALEGVQQSQLITLYLTEGGEIPGPNRLRTDAHGAIAFQFRVGPDRGLYRVLVRGADEDDLALEFWAGPPLPIRTGQL